jgi:hypothetical protein
MWSADAFRLKRASQAFSGFYNVVAGLIAGVVCWVDGAKHVVAGVLG